MRRLALALFKALHVIPFLQRLILRIVNARFMVGVVALLLDDEDRVVLFHHTYRVKHPWGMPGGWLKRSEQPAQALVREVREESGLSIRLERIVAALTDAAGPMAEIVYLARLDHGTFAPSDEVDRIEHFDPDRLPANVKPTHANVIRDFFSERSP